MVVALLHASQNTIIDLQAGVDTRTEINWVCRMCEMAEYTPCIMRTHQCSVIQKSRGSLKCIFSISNSTILPCHCTYLCFIISSKPFLWYPSRSTGFGLQSRLMRCCEFRLTLFGNSSASIPFRITLYVFIGSWAVNGGL